VLVLDEDSRKLVDNVVREDDILELRVTNIDQIEQKRPKNAETDALYILSPLPHIVDCLLADLEARRYGAYFILWTSILPPALRERLTRSRSAQDLQISYQVLNVDFHPRESHLVTLRDPYSLPVLYHPACSNLVKQHLSDIAQRVCSNAVS
jgi:syntaxin-binding protein 1